MKLTKFGAVLLVLLTAGSWLASAQTWDTSGNSKLSGTYYFRQVIYLVQYNNGELGEGTAIFGTINFNSSAGTYTGTATVVDSSEGTGTITLNGAYSISASGYGFLSSPLVTGDYVYGLVNQSGIFVGSSTETADGYNDMFVGAPLSSPAPTAAAFKGTYSIAGIDLTADLSNPGVALNYMLQVSPNGVNSLGAGSATVYIGEEGANKYTQSIASVTYAASNGAMVFTLPTTNSSYITGLKYLYLSPDGNFVFGGSPNSLDMFVGVRTGSGTPSVSGLYYQAGIDQAASGQDATLDTYYGSLSASGGNIVGHQRLLSPFVGAAYDYTYNDTYSTPASTGSYSTPVMNYVVGSNGVRVGSGIGPYLGINVALPAPTFSGPGPYLNPTGIVNAASSAPFTAGIAPGELLTLYGTGLADSLVIAPGIPFTTSLGNVQVTIGGIPAPIYYVSPTQVSVIVPYEVNTAIVDVQVTTDGNPSNTVTVFTNETSVGVFSVPPGGLGYGAVLHQNGQLVTPANPAQINETVSVYLTGLGAVSPSIADGAGGPLGTFSEATNTITADINQVAATVTYSGLAPQLAGLYQVNLTVPSGLTNGDNYLDISGPDSYTSEVLISIGGGTAAAVASGAASGAAAPRAHPRLAKVVGPVRRRIPK